MAKGKVFNVQKFSIHDGPGIRTTVFLKGCPLKCKWCSNPESQKIQAQLLWDASKCSHCQCCTKSCPQGAIRFDGGKLKISSACKQCKTCVSKCPENALTLDCEEYTVQEVVSICLQDRDFYEESGGGVTLSGGEAFVQFGFALSLLKALKQEGIHTAVETTGYTYTEKLLAAAPYVDLFLYDIKHYNRANHIDGTGVDNEKIIQNLRILLEKGYQVLPRIPVIPDFNETLEDVSGFCAFLKELNIQYVQLLPFHQFGERKYEFLAKDYEYQDYKAIHPEMLEKHLHLFCKNGIHAYI